MNIGPPQYGPTEPAATATSEKNGVAIPVASASYTPLLPDLSMYDLTVNEATELFAKNNRECPSDRTLQRYCQYGRFDCYKLKTTRSGTPVHEWIINSTSLLKFIQTKPEKVSSEKLATPKLGDDAKTLETVEDEPDDAATPDEVGDAKEELVLPGTAKKVPHDMATPQKTDDANLGDQNRVALLVENAELTARLDERNSLIRELRDDKQFLREQVIHQRKNDTQLSAMHSETLDALKAVAIAGRHTKIEMGEGNELLGPKVVAHDLNDPNHRPTDGV